MSPHINPRWGLESSRASEGIAHQAFCLLERSAMRQTAICTAAAVFPCCLSRHCALHALTLSDSRMHSLQSHSKFQVVIKAFRLSLYDPPAT